MKHILTPLTLATTLLTATPIQPVSASMLEESGMEMIARNGNCEYQKQLEMKSAFLNRWDVWMDQLLVRDGLREGGDR